MDVLQRFDCSGSSGLFDNAKQLVGGQPELARCQNVLPPDGRTQSRPTISAILVLDGAPPIGAEFGACLYRHAFGCCLNDN